MRSHPNIRAVMFLNSSKPEWVTEAFRSGALGVITRQDSIETLIKCLRRVHQGQIWANSEQTTLVIEALRASHSPLAISAQSVEHLSQREIEVIGCLAQGLTNNQIAGNLGISEHTVKNYLFRIYDKLGVSNRVELLFTIANRTRSLESTAASVEDVGVGQNLRTPSVFAGYQRAAEQGVPTAQLELAQYYCTRRSDPKDLMHAYKWYLIASHQISQMSKNVVKRMSAEQMIQAEKMAAEWPKKTLKMPAASVRTATRDRCNEITPANEATGVIKALRKWKMRSPLAKTVRRPGTRGPFSPFSIPCHVRSVQLPSDTGLSYRCDTVHKLRDGDGHRLRWHTLNP